jgi:RNA polymerase sigma factor (sigma-70 family)
MANGELGAVLKGVETLFAVGTAAGLTDVQLLDRYAGRTDPGAEAAFEALVKRHGPMVLRVCRGELVDPHAAEDAFQATFLILARKARSIRKGESLASWLYGVARRVARRARADRMRRIANERRGALMAGHPSPTDQEPPDLLPEVQEEVDRLPEKYRAPIILCYLEGLTHEEAANQLRIPVGTVKIRLSRGRERLRGRLVRRGLAPVVVASAFSATTRAAVPAPLLDTTVKAAMHVAAVRAAGVSITVTALVEGVLRAMFLSRVRAIAAILATSMTLIVSSLLVVSALSGPVRSDQEPDPPKTRERPPDHAKVSTAHTPDKPETGKTLTVKKSVFHTTTSQEGTVQAFQWANLFPRVAGALSELNVDIGDSVKRDQVVARIESPELVYELAKAKALVQQAQARMRTAEVRISVAEAALVTANSQIAAAEAEVKRLEAEQSHREKQLNRLRDLVQRRAVEERLADEESDHLRAAQAATYAAKIRVSVEKAGLETAKAKLETARAEAEETRTDVSLAEADMGKAKAAVDACEIRSPYDGVVTRRNYHVGEFVRPAARDAGAEPLLTIVQADKVRVVVQIPDRDAAFLNNGDPATFRTSVFPDREFKGTISRTAFAEEQGTVRAEIDLDNADGRLRPGQMGSVTVTLETIPDAITVPFEAILGEGFNGIDGPMSCYRMVEGRPMRTPIKIGRINHEMGKAEAEVLEGLKEGDIIAPDFRLIPDPKRQERGGLQ